MLKKYQSLVNNEIPLTRYMQWRIDQLSQEEILTTTQLEPNINVHSTGFAGSIYAAAMATGWTLLKYWYDKNEYETELVAAEAAIRYLRPVTDDFICHALLNKITPEYIKLSERLTNRKTCGFPLRVEIRCNDKVCAILTIQFVFKC